MKDKGWKEPREIEELKETECSVKNKKYAYWVQS